MQIIARKHEFIASISIWTERVQLCVYFSEIILLVHNCVKLGDFTDDVTIHVMWMKVKSCWHFKIDRIEGRTETIVIISCLGKSLKHYMIYRIAVYFHGSMAIQIYNKNNILFCLHRHIFYFICTFCKQNNVENRYHMKWQQINAK
jgi:hypothetical protein